MPAPLDSPFICCQSFTNTVAALEEGPSQSCPVVVCIVAVLEKLSSFPQNPSLDLNQSSLETFPYEV